MQLYLLIWETIFIQMHYVSLPYERPQRFDTLAQFDGR